jgi:hypothetical protein
MSEAAEAGRWVASKDEFDDETATSSAPDQSSAPALGRIVIDPEGHPSGVIHIPQWLSDILLKDQRQT